MGISVHQVKVLPLEMAQYTALRRGDNKEPMVLFQLDHLRCIGSHE